tara:strand:+ start:34278 stop:34523 length:246 start_codon:yes stop_codon:yes gene_type:complete
MSKARYKKETEQLYDSVDSLDVLIGLSLDINNINKKLYPRINSTYQVHTEDQLQCLVEIYMKLQKVQNKLSKEIGKAFTEH